MPGKRSSFIADSFSLLKQTVSEWLEDQVPQLGAALAYYTVFSLAPLVLLLLAIVGFIFHNDPAGAWRKMTEQMSYFLDKSALDVVANIAQTAAHPSKGMPATIIGILLALFGASGVFGQLQNALNTIWGVKAKPGAGIVGFIRSRFLSFAMVAGVCFLLLVSLAWSKDVMKVTVAATHAVTHEDRGGRAIVDKAIMGANAPTKQSGSQH